MIYELKPASEKLSFLIKSFWYIDSIEDSEIQKEKILPDGYPEMIFHYGDPYKINISGDWKTQSKQIIAGQIKNHFFIENTGVSKMFAIKFQPWALKELFDLTMNEITDDVISFPKEISEVLSEVQKIAIGELSFNEKVMRLEKWFLTFVTENQIQLSPKHQIVSYLIQYHGKIELLELQQKFEISERTLERYFKTYIGLSPKFYSRILRFSYIFKIIQENKIDWQDIVYQVGYYDQSHFIKNFQEFTGEDPSKYGFSAKNMANFFLK